MQPNFLTDVKMCKKLCKFSCFVAEAGSDVIGNRGDLGIGIGVAERRHRDRALWRTPLGSGNHDLDDIGRTGIVDRPCARERGEG